MKWNWEHKDWPKFRYKKEEIEKLENIFSYSSGLVFGVYKHLGTLWKTYQPFIKITKFLLKIFKKIQIVPCNKVSWDQY